MKNIFFFSLLFILCFSCQSNKKDESKPENNATVYYLIRHAEKDRSTKDSDPGLTDKGIQRAKNWANHFENIDLNKIYSTNYKRTLQTASYIAEKQLIEVQSYDPKYLYDEEFQKNTINQTVLIVGHSNTTPAFVNIILGKQEYQQIDDSDNGKLFIVTFEGDTISVEIEDYN